MDVETFIGNKYIMVVDKVYSYHPNDQDLQRRKIYRPLNLLFPIWRYIEL